MSKLTHIDKSGAAHMVDVTGKADTARAATAEAFVEMKPETLKAIVDGNAPKGDVIGPARLAGIMAAKRTHDLIPLCHPLQLSGINVSIEPETEKNRIRIETTVRTKGQTGVEMEALTAASVAALTLYDMAKALEKTMTITHIRLLHKSGGKSGDFSRSGESQ